VPRRLWLLVGLAFFASGSAALVYQVVWQRVLAFHTGVGITSIALIVAAFMAGLGLGSHVGGVLSPRVSPRAALRLFAGLEILIGVFALVSVPLYYDGLQSWASGLFLSTTGAALAHFLALLPPTFLMGMSLPFLVRALVRDALTAPRTIGILYGLNVLGAATGALVTPWWLLRFYGMEGAVHWGVAANILAGLAALAGGALADWATEPTLSGPPAEVSPSPRLLTPEGPIGRQPLALWVALYTVSGFIALSLEILWFRVVDVAVKGTAFTFGNVLSLFLVGLGLGSLVGGRLAPRWSRPLALFVTFQCALLVYSALALTLLGGMPIGMPGYSWFLDYWATDYFFQLGADWNPATLFRLYFLLPVGLYGPPTFLMGLSFAALQRAVQDDPRTSGRKVGILQAANIAGCVAGSLVGGLLLIDRLGTTGTLRVLVALGATVFLGTRLRAEGLRKPIVAWAVVLGLSLAVVPDGDAFWTRLHGVVTTDRPSFIGEDATAVSAVTPGEPGAWRVEVGGLPHSWIPYGGIHTLLGAVPAVVHPAPEEVVVVGLGSGETAWAAACRRETRSVVAYEIAAALPPLLPRVAETTPRRSLLRQFLRDARIRIVPADGRHALLRSDRRYDLIQVDALFRTSSGSGNLYSVEFFELCARRLKPGGVICTQIPSRRASLTFTAAVPHVINFGNLMVGGNDPLPIQPEVWTARLRSLEIATYLGPGPVEALAERFRDALPGRRNPETRLGLNFDLFPRDEFSTPAGVRR
jgi:predicted membrane-bound spermidine synthase